ncbi:MAG TPA: acyltransferase [Verrucomicrobiae bacterium]|nr:acyltransferase [Verrucomicrobiae bacterium]
MNDATHPNCRAALGGSIPPDGATKPATSATRTDRRNLQLDVLRGGAVLLVLGRHIEHPPQLPEPFQTLVGYWHRCGWVGVDLFFVLSGFLVAGLVFEEWKRTGNFAAGRFLIRRGFKIYPAFYLLWCLVFISQWIAGHGFDVARLLSEFLFLQNYWQPEWRHTWSLAVEEHFYLGLALLCWLRVHASTSAGRANPFLPLAWLGATLMVMCPLLRWQAATGESFDLQRQLFPTHLRIDSLMFGVLLAWCWHFQRPRLEALAWPHRGKLLLLGLALLAPTLVFSLETDRWMHVIGFSVFALGGTLLVLVAATAPVRQPNLLARGVARIGFYSYSIYLWHLPVARVLDATLAGILTPNTWLLAYLAGSLLAGMALGRLIEWPALKLRDRWFPKPQASATIQRSDQIYG